MSNLVELPTVLNNPKTIASEIEKEMALHSVNLNEAARLAIAYANSKKSAVDQAVSDVTTKQAQVQAIKDLVQAIYDSARAQTVYIDYFQSKTLTSRTSTERYLFVFDNIPPNQYHGTLRISTLYGSVLIASVLVCRTVMTYYNASCSNVHILNTDHADWDKILINRIESTAIAADPSNAGKHKLSVEISLSYGANSRFQPIDADLQLTRWR